MKIRREWCMPSRWTFSMRPVVELLKSYDVGLGWADPFAGKNIVTEYSNDLSVTGVDAYDFVKTLPNMVGFLFDPPYSLEQCKRSYNAASITNWQTRFGNNKSGGFSNVKNVIAENLLPGGKVISFGWNSNGMGKRREFEIIEVMILAHGGNHNDTICVVEEKKPFPKFLEGKG